MGTKSKFCPRPVSPDVTGSQVNCLKIKGTTFLTLNVPIHRLKKILGTNFVPSLYSLYELCKKRNKYIYKVIAENGDKIGRTSFVPMYRPKQDACTKFLGDNFVPGILFFPMYRLKRGDKMGTKFCPRAQILSPHFLTTYTLALLLHTIPIIV